MPRKNWPNYIVFFNNIYDDIKYIFENSNYKEVSFILFHEKKKIFFSGLHSAKSLVSK